MTPHRSDVDIDLPLADRRDGKVRVSYACGDDRGCSSPPTACRRSTGSSPACRTRARCSTSSPRGGSSAPPTSSPTTSSPSPTRTCSSPAAPRRCRSRSSCAATSPASPHVAVAAVRRRRSAPIYGYRFPDGLRKNTALPDGDHHADHQGRARRPRRAADLRRRRRARASSPPTCGTQVAARRAGAVRPRPAGGRRRRADPRRHEVRVRH